MIRKGVEKMKISQKKKVTNKKPRPRSLSGEPRKLTSKRKSLKAIIREK